MEPIKEFLSAHWADILGAIVVIRVIAAIVRTRVPDDGSKADGVLDVIEACFHWAKVASGWAKLCGRPDVARVLDVIGGPDSEPPPASPASTEPITLDLTRDIPPALQPAVSPPANSNPDPPEAAQ